MKSAITTASVHTDNRKEGFPSTKCLINGRWIDGDGSFPVLDKYSFDVLTEVAVPSRTQVAEAVVGARAAFQRFVTTPVERARWLRRAADIIEAQRNEFVRIMMLEGGFTIDDINAEIDRSLITLNLSAEEATRIVGETVALAATPGQHERIGFTIRVPLGVVCAITPFNAPLNVVLHKVAPALAAGNAVILKPSAFTPLTASLLCEVLLDAGVPPAMLTLVHGEGAATGEALLDEQDIDFYTFTGSTAVGRLIQRGAGLRRTQLELGSIASTIVCTDADLDMALPKIANAAFRKAGQVCTSTQRLYVQEQIVEDVSDRLVQHAARMKAGDPADKANRVGPMIAEAAAKRAEDWINEARSQQARILQGGERDGAVLQPTVIANAPSSAKVLTQEIFAPVVTVVPFRNVAEAIEGANNTPFGLAAGIFTQNIGEAIGAARQLRFGGVHINETSSSRVDGMPFGGVKESGIGHEGPRYAVRDLTEERLITIMPTAF